MQYDYEYDDISGLGQSIYLDEERCKFFAWMADCADTWAGATQASPPRIHTQPAPTREITRYRREHVTNYHPPVCVR
jgi:hypothetical protein